MRCSLKDGFVILLIFSFTPFEGKGYPLFLYKNSIADRSINFNDLSAMSRVEQSLDSFPKLGDYNKNSHKIVKKQMTASDYKHTQKNKRSTFSFKESSNLEDNLKSQCKENSEQAIAESSSKNDFKKQKSAFPILKQRRSLGIETKFFERLTKSDMFPALAFNKKEKFKKMSERKKEMREKELEKLDEKRIESELEKTIEPLNQTESVLQTATESLISEKQKANEELHKKGLTTDKKDLEKGTKKGSKPVSSKATGNTSSVEKESKETPALSFDYKNFRLNDSDIKEQYRALRNMVGCNMGRFCRFPDVQSNYNYFECESDDNGCIKLKYKNCPNGEIFSPTFLECVKPYFWEIVERQKRSLWKKEKKQYPNTWESGQFANAWTDVTHEEGKQFPFELRPKCKPKLVVYHLKVKKALKENSQKEKKAQRRIVRMPTLAHSEISRRLTQKVANLNKKEHQLFPRSFIIRINKKEGGKSDHEESVSEDEADETEDNGDDEDDDEDDDEIKDDEDVSEEEEESEDDDDEEEKKPVEKSGIKEFFKSAKEAITNRAKFNEPADTSFTLDKTNSYTKNKKLNGSENDSKKVLIDADIKVDKALGKTLKRILGKRKDENVSSDGNIINDQGSQDLTESEQITMYENLIKSNPRLKRYFLVSLGEKEN